MTKQERAALRDVNRIRKAEGRKVLKRLPKGTPEEEYNCPIARALDGGKVGVGIDSGDLLVIPAGKLAAYLAAGLKLSDDTVSLRMPKSFEKFVAWFDAQDSAQARQLNVDPQPEPEEEA